MAKLRSEEIRQYILENVDNHPTDITKITAQHFKITRQAVNKHLQKLTTEKILTETGQTRSRIYQLKPLFEWKRSYQIIPGLAEDLIWRNDIAVTLGKMSANVLDIWQHGFTEMFNNAIDHSDGSIIDVYIQKTAVNTEMLIRDNGIGIFKKIQIALNLLDERHALFELSKGKLTTDPKHHSGEGIFFTSRMFDAYDILSGGVFFAHTFGKSEDWIVERGHSEHGTSVRMKLKNHTSRTSTKIFDQYALPDEYRFDKTVVPVKLAQYGNDKLISRSQAKRLLARIELFKIVIFDFKDIDFIGQAFADEIFRVFAVQHPEIQITYLHANTTVKQMIERVGGASMKE